MVFVDVTDACTSPRNTGIERMTRRIFAELEARCEATPLCWNRFARRYHKLGPVELGNLRAPFRAGTAPSARPELQGANAFGELRRFFASAPIDLEKQILTGDVFLMPDIFRDGRVHLLSAAAWETSARTVAIFHDALALTSPFFSSSERERFRKYIRSLAQFDLVICVSRESEGDLQAFWKELGVAASATLVEEWPIEFDGALRSSTPSGSSNVVLCVSSLAPHKNHLALLEAAARLWRNGTNFELRMVGRSTSSKGLHPVVREINKLQSAGHPIAWLRHVDEKRLHRAYRECRFTVYPSLKEGFGLPILESLWHGKPCICGQNGALGEAGAGGGCLFVDQTNPATLADGMKQLLGDAQLYNRLCDEARRRNFRLWSNYMECLMGHIS